MRFSAITTIEQTQDIAKHIASSVTAGDILLLFGTLGAGKTALVKSIAEALGVKEEVTSPTFSLMNTYAVAPPYNTIKKIVHIDTYRSNSPEEFLDIGIEEYLHDPEALICIEWPELLEDILAPLSTKKIYITQPSPGVREIELSWIV